MSYHNNPTEPKLKLPAGACDAHFHVFGPRDKFAYAKDAPYVPEVDAPKDVLIDRHMFLGIERGVVVQSAAHGLDNSAAADLLAEKGKLRRCGARPGECGHVASQEAARAGLPRRAL